jgi:hypothetical protein
MGHHPSGRTHDRPELVARPAGAITETTVETTTTPPAGGDTTVVGIYARAPFIVIWETTRACA